MPILKTQKKLLFLLGISLLIVLFFLPELINMQNREASKSLCSLNKRVCTLKFADNSAQLDITERPIKRASTLQFTLESDSLSNPVIRLSFEGKEMPMGIYSTELKKTESNHWQGSIDLGAYGHDMTWITTLTVVQGKKEYKQQVSFTAD